MDIAECYRVLELTSLASAKDIKSSYRRLARQWHPDVNPNSEHAHEMFIRLTEAYGVLQNVVPTHPPSSSSPFRPQATGPQATGPQATGPQATGPQATDYRPSHRPSHRPVTASQGTSTPSQSSQTVGEPSPQQHPQSSSFKTSQAIPKPSQTTSTNFATSKVSPASRTQASSTFEEPSRPTPNPQSSPPSQSRNVSAQFVAQQAQLESALKIQAYKQLQALIKGNRYPRAVTLVEALSQRLPQDAEVRQWQAIIYQRRGRQLINERKYNQARAYLKKAIATDPNNKSLLTEIEGDLQSLRASV